MSDQLDSADQKLSRRGKILSTCLWYPGIDDHALGFEITLIDVRYAPGVHVTFDKAKDKWVISTSDGSPASDWIETSETPVCFDGSREHEKSTTDGQTMCDRCGYESPEDKARFEEHLERTRTWRGP